VPVNVSGVVADHDPLRILLSTPVYWPSTAFGGPVQVVRALVEGFVARGHSVEVITSSLVELGRPGARRTSSVELDGARIIRAATPARFRWLGMTPTVPRLLNELERPDIVHIFGFRDPVGTFVARWCQRERVPYVFEALGMFTPKLRKVVAKRVLDATVYRAVARRATTLVAASSREADEYARAGAPPPPVVVRPNGFPAPMPQPPRPGRLRRLLGLGAQDPLVLSLGRIAHGKGLELVLAAASELPDSVHVAFVGPDDRHGAAEDLRRLRRTLGLTERVHFVEPLGPSPPLDVYADADVFVLASAHENFGLVAAEAAAAGTPSVVSDRCGVAEFLGAQAALIVPYDVEAVRNAIARLLDDEDLRRRLGDGGREVAAEHGWSRIVDQQEALYREILSR
jgi:glycosyltransferase involved in cell wall biosynthesis